MNLDTTLEIVRAVLGMGLVLANIAVWYGVWLERDSAPLEEQQRGWRILVRGLAAETALGLFLFAADTSIGLKQTAEIASANKDATDLVNSFGGLHKFVTDQENKNAVAIADLKQNSSDLEKARNDAVTAANNAKADIAKAEDALTKEKAIRDQIVAMNTPRTIVPDKQNPFIQRLKPFSGLTVNVLTPVQNDSDAGPLATLLVDLLTKAGWKVGTGSPGTGWSKMVLVCTGDHPSEKVTGAAQTIVLAMRAAGIPSFIDPQLGPNIPMSGFASTLPNPDMTILVGSKQ